MIQIDDAHTRQYTFEKAKTPWDLYNALKLVKNVYIQEGYIDKTKDSSPIRILKNHLHDESGVFIGKDGADVVFTVSLFPDAPFGLPMDDIYKDLLDRFRSKGRKIAEVGCLATHPYHRSGTQNILMHGNKILMKYAMEKLKLDDLVIIVHPKHVPVYKKVLLFDELDPGTIRAFPKVNNNPAVALHMDLNEAERKFRACYRDYPLETNLHHFLFIKESPNLESFNNGYLNLPAPAARQAGPGKWMRF